MAYTSIPKEFRISLETETSHEPLFEQEGQLSVDVVNTDDEMHVIAPVSGVDMQTLEMSIHNDVLTIRGVRSFPLSIEKEVRMLHQECYWGKFSRTIVLPVPVIGERAQAVHERGLLHITIPKRSIDRVIPITIIDD